MSRWSRRSEEDKKRIAGEQQQLKKTKGQVRHESKQKQINEIYKEWKIPIDCSNCDRIVAPEKLIAYTEPMPFTGKKWHKIRGQCPYCEKILTRWFPFANNIFEVQIFMGAFMKMGCAGNIIDSRTELDTNSGNE